MQRTPAVHTDQYLPQGIIYSQMTTAGKPPQPIVQNQFVFLAASPDSRFIAVFDSTF